MKNKQQQKGFWRTWMGAGMVGMAIALGTWGIPTVAIASPGFSHPQIAQLNCNNPQTQSEMNACAARNWQSADRELNQVYQTLTPNLSPSRRQKLVTAQRRWIEFRDAECEFYSSLIAYGGSMQPMLRSGCMETLTEQRSSELYQYRRGEIPRAIGTNYQSSDRRLNTVYQQLMGKLEGFLKEQLKDAELAWIAYRDALCEFERTGGGNAGYDTCMIRTTEQRTVQLENHL
ncbi:lysozyme inhibitor LprI family protein [Phormidium sp. CCY1219]|uniref:lysozyme inhibitor LprI family protein n=1 Tax=Phormidium sp. CCY1219 TaxID=2886104 RepID=UPI002D1E6D84|nr:lysozyme inhibitor LprI family protein [Phormidium sp. CCY1219]MEB3831554.1 lysozyme inhibitor LprI family protein [Phormidium sp. CCY1219]